MKRRNKRRQLSRVRSVTNILWFCVYAWMYLKFRNKYKIFINVSLIFTKPCIPILLLNNQNVLLPLFSYYQWKSRLLNICEETQQVFCVFSKKNFSLSLKNYFFSMTWNFGNKFGPLNKWYRLYRLNWISWKNFFSLFYFVKKNPGLKSSLFWSGYLNILISGIRILFSL